MTLIVHPDYHAVPILERNGIRWIPPSQAKRQDIRPLRIGILNIMPLGEKYEFNILHPLGLSVLQLEPIWIRLESHNYKSWEPKHVDDIYVTYEEAMREQPLDGLILTGAPVETIDFEDVYYWEEIKTILSDARKNIPSTLGLCWAGFVMAYLEGVKKLNYDHKLFGVFELKNLAPEHPIIGELDDVFWNHKSALPEKGWASLLLVHDEEHPMMLVHVLSLREDGLLSRENMDRVIEAHAGQNPAKETLAAYCEAHELAPGDVSGLADVIDKIIAERLDFVKERGMGAMGPLMGIVMQAAGGADGKEVSALLRAAIQSVTE